MTLDGNAMVGGPEVITPEMYEALRMKYVAARNLAVLRSVAFYVAQNHDLPLGEANRRAKEDVATWITVATADHSGLPGWNGEDGRFYD